MKYYFSYINKYTLLYVFSLMYLYINPSSQKHIYNTILYHTYSKIKLNNLYGNYNTLRLNILLNLVYKLKYNYYINELGSYTNHYCKFKTNDYILKYPLVYKKIILSNKYLDKATILNKIALNNNNKATKLMLNFINLYL